MTMAMLMAALVGAASAEAQQPAPSHTPAARAAIADFAGCVARRSPDKAHSALTMDFTSSDYRAALRALAEVNRDCHGSRSTIRAGGLAFAAAMAEALLRNSPAPLNVRLLNAAGRQAPTFTRSDRVAMCIARSDPDNVAALLQSPIAGPAEAAAAGALQVARTRCSPPGVALAADGYALRSILATASYRLLAAPASTERG